MTNARRLSPRWRRAVPAPVVAVLRGVVPALGMALAFGLALGGCGGAASVPPEDGSAGSDLGTSSVEVPEGDAIRVEDARAVQVPGTGTGAAYFRLINPTDRDDLLVAVSTPVARVAEVHETLEEDGLMRMVAFPEGMPVPARSVVELRPGAKHVMLLALHEDLPLGGEIPLRLELRNAGPVELSVPVSDLGSGASGP